MLLNTQSLPNAVWIYIKHINIRWCANWDLDFVSFSCLQIFYEAIQSGIVSTENTESPTLKFHGGQGTGMRHRNCFKSWLRKKLLWSLTSWDITTTTWFLGKRDTTLYDKRLMERKLSFWRSPLLSRKKPQNPLMEISWRIKQPYLNVHFICGERLMWIGYTINKI